MGLKCNSTIKQIIKRHIYSRLYVKKDNIEHNTLECNKIQIPFFLLHFRGLAIINLLLQKPYMQIVFGCMIYATLLTIDSDYLICIATIYYLEKKYFVR